MRKLVGLSGVLAILSVAIGGSAAQANSLAAGTGSVTCLTETRTTINDPVSCNGGADSGMVTYAPFAGLSGRAFGQGLKDSANVFGVLDYSFEVTGGTRGTVVPVDIDAVLQENANLIGSNSIGYAFAEIDVTAYTSAGVTICSSGCTGQTGFTGILHVDAQSGFVDTVHLEIEAGGAFGNSSDFNGGMASADPYIYIDPNFAAAGDYSIEVSPNIGNVPATPLPATAWLLGSALGGAGLFMRRRRKTSAVYT